MEESGTKRSPPDQKSPTLPLSGSKRLKHIGEFLRNLKADLSDCPFVCSDRFLKDIFNLFWGLKSSKMAEIPTWRLRRVGLKKNIFRTFDQNTPELSAG